MVADDHHVVAVRIVAVVAHKGVVISALNVLRDLHPRGGVTVHPSLVGVGRYFLASSVGSAVHAFVIFEDVRVVLGQTQHAGFHCLVGVVLFELQNVVVGRCPRENHVDVILGPYVLGGVT